MSGVNRLRALCASLTCYAVVSLLLFTSSCLCWCFEWWMCCIVSHVIHRNSLMFVVQCFVYDAFVLFHPLIPCCPALSVSFCLSLSLSHTRCTSTCNIIRIHARAHAHTPTACHLAGCLISSYLVGFTTSSFSAFNSPSYPPFLALSIVTSSSRT